MPHGLGPMSRRDWLLLAVLALVLAVAFLWAQLSPDDNCDGLRVLCADGPDPMTPVATLGPTTQGGWHATLSSV
jgi:hypothetical protein